MNITSDFRKYATRHLGMSGHTLDDVMAAQSQYLNPYILEERQLNVTQMDVFSRLMMDRIIFLGTEVNDYTANIIQAQLLYLDSTDPGKDISIYINSPGGSVTAGLGIYDTMQFISSDVATICTGMAASMGAVLLVAGQEGKRSALPHSRVMIHQPLGGVQGQGMGRLRPQLLDDSGRGQGIRHDRPGTRKEITTGIHTYTRSVRRGLHAHVYIIR